MFGKCWEHLETCWVMLAYSVHVYGNDVNMLGTCWKQVGKFWEHVATCCEHFRFVWTHMKRTTRSLRTLWNISETHVVGFVLEHQNISQTHHRIFLSLELSGSKLFYFTQGALWVLCHFVGRGRVSLAARREGY